MTTTTTFGVEVGLDARTAVLAVRGEVDLLTAPTLGAALSAFVGAGRHVVVDLGDVGFIDAIGIGVIALAAERARSSAGRLTIRSAPPQTRWILDVAGLADLLEGERPDERTLGPEQHDAPGSPEEATDELRTDLARVGALPANTDVVFSALRLVASLVAATVEGADGVSVSLTRHNRLDTVASTDETVRLMDRHQYETGEGPCLAAATEGHWFHIESLAAERRWPSFTPRAMQQGIASILSTPLVAAGRPLGALNIYSRTTGAFGPRDQELVALFASQASGILVDAGVDVTDEELGARILQALRSRQVIAQAQGVLIGANRLDPEEAAASLHRAARDAGVRVVDHATTVVTAASAPAEPAQPTEAPGRG